MRLLESIMKDRDDRSNEILIIQKTCDDILSTRVEVRGGVEKRMSREDIVRVCGFMYAISE